MKLTPLADRVILKMVEAEETAGAEDTSSMVKALTVFYGKSLALTEDGLALV